MQLHILTGHATPHGKRIIVCQGDQVLWLWQRIRDDSMAVASLDTLRHTIMGNTSTSTEILEY